MRHSLLIPRGRVSRCLPLWAGLLLGSGCSGDGAQGNNGDTIKAIPGAGGAAPGVVSVSPVSAGTAGSTSATAGRGVNVQVAGRASNVTGGVSGIDRGDGALPTGGRTVGGGASDRGGTPGSAGTPGIPGVPGTCEPGSSTTAWATGCPTSAPACTSGTWTAGGPDPDHSGFKLIAESTHFAIYSDESPSTATAQSALDTLEKSIWNVYFGSPIFLKEPLCDQAVKTKASIHVHSDWGLTGGGWTPTRMGMWIGSGALNDHWGLAHEFTHAVQAVSGGMSCDRSNTCGWIHESHANFMPHQLAEYRSDEHCSEMLFNAPHLYLGSTRDRYCNWQFMEYLKDKYCYSAVNAIWDSKPANSDPFTAIMKARGWDIAQLNDFMGEWALHNVTWDYQNPSPTLPNDTTDPGTAFRRSYGLITDTSKPERRLRLTRLEPLGDTYATDRRFVSPQYWAPQRWGYNVIRLYPEAGMSSVAVTFRGVVQSGANSDWRWGVVATNSALTAARYSPLQRGADGQLNFCVNAGEALWLVVMGTPSVQQPIVWDQPYPSIYRYPYAVELNGAWPEGFRNGSPDACPSGTARHSNGEGCAPAGLPSTVYVGPYATVLGGAVTGNARIEDQAVVLSGATVSGGTVGALSILSRFSVSGSAVAQSTFYPLGFFETGQGLSGTAQLLGDIEYRGIGLNKATGSYTGMVETTTASSTLNDITVAPPYTWRP